MSEENNWVLACLADEVEDEGVLQFDYKDSSFAIYNLGGAFYATDGYCTHEREHLAGGFVIDGMIECPLHMGQFDIETGEAIAGPVCINLKTYPTNVEDGQIYLNLKI